MTILISDPDQEWSERIEQFLIQKNLKVETCYTGKDCQLKVFKNSFKSLILDFDLTNHSALEVLRFMRLNHPQIRVILTFSSQEKLKSLGLTKEDLLKLGADDLFIKPFPLEKLFKSMEGESQFSDWKKIIGSNEASDEKEMTVQDQEFTHVKRDVFHKGSTTIFDLYIRIGPHRYIKILHKGDFFDDSRLKKYDTDTSLEFLYFKTKDRGIYINFINDLLSKSLAQNKGTSEHRMRSTKSLVEKYVEEIYTVGLKPQLVEEGKTICQNMYDFIKKDKGLYDVLSTYEDYDPPAYAHLFLTSFLSTIITKNLEWTSSRTVEMTVMAGLLHDIGMLKLPADLKEKRPVDMSPAQLKLYKTHPLLGLEMLKNYSHIPESVKQIIFQHHEWMNGEGFPNGLSGMKIYPLAKITGLADEFSNYLIEKKVPPLKGLREFLGNREALIRFDSNMMKCLVQGFLKDKDKDKK